MLPFTTSKWYPFCATSVQVLYCYLLVVSYTLPVYVVYVLLLWNMGTPRWRIRASTLEGALLHRKHPLLCPRYRTSYSISRGLNPFITIHKQVLFWSCSGTRSVLVLD